MAVSISRQIAFDVLQSVEAEGAYASDVLHAKLDAGANSKLKSGDAALSTELVMGVLRWRRLLDFLLDRRMKKPVERLDLPVAIALRMGAYQIRFLEGIPARAAVHESVEIVKRARKSSAASLVNAVLRKIAAEAKARAETLLPSGMSAAESLGILHSHPTWMVERWLARFDEADTIALLEANNRTPRLTCAIHAPDERAEIVRSLETAGMHVEDGALLKTAFAVSGGSPSRSEAFRTGKISIQDEASQVIPLLLGVRPGDRVLDLCAAPGGKTALLARAAGSSGTVIAADLHAHRVHAMKAQCQRLGLQNVQLIELDATQTISLPGEFDRILVDAPCSGTGTLARHPEIRWRLHAENLAESQKLQMQILRNALTKLAPGGRLVYSTCSIEPEENERVVTKVQADTPSLHKIPAAESERALAPHLAPGVNASSLFGSNGFFRTSPAAHRADGFFAAILEKP